MLAPNWSDHDIETNPIVNYFADRQHTELILRKIEKKIKTAAFTAKNVKTATNFFSTKKCSNNKASGHLTARSNTGMYTTQIGVKRTNFLNLCQLEISDLRCKKTCYFLRIPLIFTRYLTI